MKDIEVRKVVVFNSYQNFDMDNFLLNFISHCTILPDIYKKEQTKKNFILKNVKHNKKIKERKIK